MPKPQELCVVKAGGIAYNIWQTVEVTSAVDQVIDHAMLTVAEPSSKATNLAGIKLKPGDPATVTLAGQTVIDGVVYLRQGVANANMHAVQIGIVSKAKPITVSTVRASPGQYRNQTLEQMVSSVFGEVGVPFSLKGAPAGADKVFARVSEHVGETRYDFAERLARMRNIHLIDDGQNGIMGFRGPFGNAATQVVEGHNMLRGRILLKDNESVEQLRCRGQQANQDDAYANAQSAAEKQVQTSAKGDATIVAEEMADNVDCQMRVNHEGDWIAYDEVDGEVALQGWLNSEGQLWWNDRLKVVTVQSPLLLPGAAYPFMIKSVVHRQSSEEGTTTTLLLCRADGLGGGAEPLWQDS